MNTQEMTAGVLVHTPNYIFNRDDFLGKGATCKVYKGLNKETGETYAIKEFHKGSGFINSFEKEKESMCKLKHRNIVKFHGHESVEATNYIILEYCSGNSVSTLLQKPENHYGFPPDLFFKFQNQVTEALNHFHRMGYMHRDIKPGNIMEHRSNDGEVVFKVSDFGAARVIRQDDIDRGMPSLAGTLEYLPPEIHDRAALCRKTVTDPLKIDLWSTGSTLYHVATGQVPFKPTKGRRDPSTMSKMLNEKPDGTIAAHQNPKTKEITWFKKLPDTCRLSLPHKERLADILSKLMATMINERYSFEDYYTATSNFLQAIPVTIFHADTGKILTILLDPTTSTSYTKFQEHVAKATKIDASSQLLLMDGQPAQKHWPQPKDIQNKLDSKSMESSPVYLFNKNSRPDSQDLDHYTPAPEFMPFSSKTELLQYDEDSKIANKNTGTAFLTMEAMDSNHRKEKLLKESAKELANLARERQEALSMLTDVIHNHTTDIAEKFKYYKQIHEAANKLFLTMSENTQGNDDLTELQNEALILTTIIKRLETHYPNINQLITVEEQKIEGLKNMEMENPMLTDQAHHYDTCSSCTHAMVNSMKTQFNEISKRATKMRKTNPTPNESQCTFASLEHKGNINTCNQLVKGLSNRQSECRKSFMQCLKHTQQKNRQTLSFLETLNNKNVVLTVIQEKLHNEQALINNLEQRASYTICRIFDISGKLVRPPQPPSGFSLQQETLMTSMKQTLASYTEIEQQESTASLKQQIEENKSKFKRELESMNSLFEEMNFTVESSKTEKPSTK